MQPKVLANFCARHNFLVINLTRDIRETSRRDFDETFFILKYTINN